jgi:hypothetical protein
VLAGLGFQDSLVDLQCSKARDDVVEQGFLRRFVDVGRRGTVHRACREAGRLHAHFGFRSQRQERPHARDLAQGVDVVRVGQINLVGAAGEKLFYGQLADGRDVHEGRVARNGSELGDEVLAAPQQELAALAANGHKIHRRGGGADKVHGRAHHVGVVGAAKAAVAGDQQDRDLPDLVARLEQRVQAAGRARLGAQVLQDLVGLAGVGARGQHLLLGAAHLGRTDRFQRAGHLGDIANAPHAEPH